MGILDNHKAMQDLPTPVRRKVYWRTLRSSRLHMCLLGCSIVWGAVYVTLLILDMHDLWSGILTVLVIGSMYPLQMIQPRRRLATALLEMNVRPSHCGYCEYDLQATTAEHCPECGSRLAPGPPTNTEQHSTSSPPHVGVPPT
jgi:hypothetical protein